MAFSSRVLLAVAFGGLVVAGCTAGPGHPTPSGSTAPFIAPLTPSIPGLFRTGINHCGDPYAVSDHDPEDGPARRLPRQGTSFIALHRGSVIITVHGANCVSDTARVQSGTCPLLKLEVR